MAAPRRAETLERLQIAIRSHRLSFPNARHVLSCHCRYGDDVLPVIYRNQRSSLLRSLHLQSPRHFFKYHIPPRNWSGRHRHVSSYHSRSALYRQARP